VAEPRGGVLPPPKLANWEGEFDKKFPHRGKIQRWRKVRWK